MLRRHVLVLAGVGLLASCKSEPARPGQASRQEVTVFAAASLREAFTELTRTFERAYPGAHVVLSFAGSQTLRSQIEHGAPADVFASADEKQMAALGSAGRVRAPLLFANNELVVVVARAKANTLRTLAELPNAERIVLGAPQVPVGAYGVKALEQLQGLFGPDFRARVEARVVSREPDVRQVLAKVSLGEADAGIVYRTDALSAKDQVAVLRIPTKYNVIASYPIAVTAGTNVPALAQAFVDLVRSPDGAAVLKQQGFTPVGKVAIKP
jgi:molybdate transport system substrate-binding protein